MSDTPTLPDDPLEAILNDSGAAHRRRKWERLRSLVAGFDDRLNALHNAWHVDQPAFSGPPTAICAALACWLKRWGDTVQRRGALARNVLKEWQPPEDQTTRSEKELRYGFVLLTVRRAADHGYSVTQLANDLLRVYETAPRLLVELVIKGQGLHLIHRSIEWALWRQRERCEPGCLATIPQAEAGASVRSDRKEPGDQPPEAQATVAPGSPPEVDEGALAVCPANLGERQPGSPDHDDEATESGRNPSSDPAKKPRHTTQRGDASDKLIAFLSAHHKYDDGSCLNLEPIGNNELAEKAGVATSTASEFFKKRFGGYPRYLLACRDTSRLADSLKLLRGEFSPRDRYGRTPPGEGRDEDR